MFAFFTLSFSKLKKFKMYGKFIKNSTKKDFVFPNQNCSILVCQLGNMLFKISSTILTNKFVLFRDGISFFSK